jgi:hypothetical protein
MKKYSREANIFFAVVLGLMLLIACVSLFFVMADPTEAAPENAPLAQATRQVLTVTALSREGITNTLYTANGAGHKISNNGRTWVEIANAYTNTITATIVTPGTIFGLAIADLDIAVPAGSTYLAGSFPPSQFNQQSGSDLGYMYLNWNATVTGTVANSVTLRGWRLP